MATFSNIYSAARRGTDNEFARFVRDNKKNLNINYTNSWGWTPLMIAAYRGAFHIVKRLVKLKAKVNSQTQKGWTALMYAASKGERAVVELLIKNSADVNLQAKNWESAITAAARSSQWGVVRTLINNDARVELATRSKETALHFAVKAGAFNTAQQIITSKNGALTIDFQDQQGRTALHMAAAAGNMSICAILLYNHANKWTNDIWKLTAEARAINNGYSLLAVYIANY